MKYGLFFIILSAGIINLSLSETHLSDEIGERVFEPNGNPYIIEQDIIIPKNTQSTIKAGCVFLFKSFTGLNVYGNLIVEGTVEKPVIFTSINDAKYYPDAQQLPNAFDWNGIYISEESKDIKLRNFEIMYSVYGIKSKKEKMTLQNAIFKQNGQFNFTIDNNIIYVQDKISYDYMPPDIGEKDKTDKTKATTTVTESKENETTSITIRNPSEAKRKRRIAGVVVLCFGILNGAASLGTGVISYQYWNKMDDIRDLIANEPPDNVNELGREWDSYKDKYNITLPASIVTGTIFGLSIPIALYLFLKSDKNTTIKTISLDLFGNSQCYYVGFTHFF
ncbi:MAG: hypothetical protein PVI26_05320 [Chitinispirillia bacterium]|jgi:hypothetical protein